MERLAALGAPNTLLRSQLYLSRPMGPQDQPDFINAAVGLLTQHSPQEMLAGLLDIERSMGRNRRERWGPRVIDLDLVWMVDAAVDEPGLTVPHPGVSIRNFVLYPLADIAPTINIPGIGTVLDLKLKVGGEGISVLE
jgi:2-amino-4-hydroxy-6-hydroxymethyldihydropteridine diphosphokinase